jgi:hypothetical protein
MHNHIPVFARYQWLNHPRVRRVLDPHFRYKGKGRRGYDKTTLFLWLIYKQLYGCSYRDLESVSGIDYSTFIKFRSRMKRRMPVLFGNLVSKALSRIKRLNLILDSSFVETYSGRDEEGSGYSGYKEKNGFKTHEIIDFASRLPLFQIATAGNVADITAGKSLLSRAPPHLPVKSFAADKGYDSEYFVHDICKKWKKVKVAIPVRRKKGDDGRNRAGRRLERTTDPVLYKRRTEIERHFSRKKRVYRLGEERTWHFENFRASAYLTSCMAILEWLSKQPA